jgi:hypothetical protein
VVRRLVGRPPDFIVSETDEVAAGGRRVDVYGRTFAGGGLPLRKAEARGLGRRAGYRQMRELAQAYTARGEDEKKPDRHNQPEDNVHAAENPAHPGDPVAV